jgi:hypothetical protein
VGSELTESGTAQASVLKPGLTGFVRIHHQEGLTPEEKVEYEIYYLRHQSLMLDVQVLLRALWNLIAGRDSRRGWPSQLVAKSKRPDMATGPLLDDEGVENERVRSRF